MKVQQRHGISPLIATIILIAITVIGGALVYTIFLSTASSSTGGISVQISSVSLSAANGLTMNVKNSGSNNITSSSTVAISSDALPPCAIGTCALPVVISIGPGQTQAVDIPGTLPVSPGTSYTITFIAHDSAGSTASFTYTVTATS